MNIDEMLRALVNQTSDFAILLIDPAGSIMWMNPAAERIFGKSSADAIGQHSASLFTHEDVAEGIDINELLTARVAPSAEDDRWLVRADGSRFWANGAMVRLTDDTGRLIGFGKILRNRTDLREHLDALRNQVAAAGATMNRKDQFISTLSHELRNPIAPLIHAVEVLKLQTPQYPEIRSSVELLERQAAQLRHLIEDLLDLSRIEHGKIELNASSIDLCEVVRRSADSVRPLMRQREHLLQLLLPLSPLMIRGDAARLEQVFVNLLTNAAKYTLRGGEVWVKGTTEGNDAVVHVQDSGVGIEPEMIEAIFELFTQVDSSQALSGGGLGIGLALVAQLVALHGGFVHARSEGPGKGSVFTVRLPMI